MIMMDKFVSFLFSLCIVASINKVEIEKKVLKYTSLIFDTLRSWFNSFIDISKTGRSSLENFQLKIKED